MLHQRSGCAVIIGTAGHIDHGKTALTRALTGVDTDRLKEEKARGISIDLGFAYLPAPDGSVLGFVDVPGHEKFVRNMLAGATGIDFVLLAVAADDGVMPQTREHLAILDLLGIRRGIVALTKADLADASQRAEIAAEIVGALSDTGLAGTEILPVSTVSGEGIDALRAALFTASAAFGARAVCGRFRLAVDRSFTLAGTGTIVTGTVPPGAHPLRSRPEPAGDARGDRRALRAQSCRRGDQQGRYYARRYGGRSGPACADGAPRRESAFARERNPAAGALDSGPPASRRN